MSRRRRTRLAVFSSWFEYPGFEAEVRASASEFNLVALGTTVCQILQKGTRIRVAHAHVAWHPAAGLESFAAQERAKRPARRIPAFPTDATFDITSLPTDSPT